MPENDILRLATINFSPVQFKPVEFTPQVPDVNIVARRLDKMETIHNQVTEQEAKLNSVLGEVGAQLHQDLETLKWFENYKSEIRNEFNSLVGDGKDSQALRMAVRKAGEIAKNPELIARLKSNKDYQVVHDSVQKDNKLAEISKQRFDDEAQYKFDPIVNNNGEVIGTKDYNPALPVEYNDWNKLGALAIQFVAPQGSGGKSTRVVGENVVSSGGSRKSLNSDTIISIMPKVFESAPGSEAALTQEYKDFDWKVNKLEDEIDKLIAEEGDNDEIQKLKDERSLYMNQLYDENGIRRTEKEFFMNKLKPILKSAGYVISDSENSTLPKTSLSSNDGSTSGSNEGSYAGQIIKAAGDNVYEAGQLPGNTNQEGAQTSQVVSAAITNANRIFNNNKK